MNVDSGILGVGVALLVAFAAACWRFASLRGSISERWGARIPIAGTGLEDRALQQLIGLRSNIDELLGSQTAFDPLTWLVDPTSLKAQVSKALRLLRARERLDKRYRWLLRSAPWLLVFGILSATATVPSFGTWSGLIDVPWLARAGWVALSVGAAGIILGFVAYSYLQHLLAGAEILANEDRL